MTVPTQEDVGKLMHEVFFGGMVGQLQISGMFLKIVPEYSFPTVSAPNTPGPFRRTRVVLNREGVVWLVQS